MLAWAHWWNTEHHPDSLHGRTPLEAWKADPTPLTDIPPDDLWSFTLEDDSRTRVITSHGVRFKRRDYLADEATPEQLCALRRASSRRAQRLRADAKAAEQLRQERFAPTTTATAPQRLEAVTTTEATRELALHRPSDLAVLALPDLIPPAPPPADWATPDALKTRTRPAHPADRPVRNAS